MSTSTSDLIDRFGPHWREVRRRLHRIPELGLDLPLTQAVILEELAPLDLEITTGHALTSVVAVVRGAAPVTGERPVVLLRGDMDALPVTEEVSGDFVSEHPGVMHACGHDLHVAGLLGAARLLHERREELVGDVVLMFQPGEEGPGGAEPMLAEGVLEAAGRRADVAYAVHVFSSEQPLGMWFGRPGPLMAAADEMTITVRGEGGHGAAPHRTKDPVPVACEIVLALQAMVARKFYVFDPVIVTVGQIVAGTKNNIIGDTALLDLTIRTFSAEQRQRAAEEIDRVARGIASAHAMTAEVLLTPGYPATINDGAEQAFAEETIRDLFGANRWTDQTFPEGGSEDMSFVLDEIPGAYVNIGACPAAYDPETAPDNHSPRAEFDDSVVPDIALFLAESAIRRSRALAEHVTAPIGPTT